MGGEEKENGFKAGRIFPNRRGCAGFVSEAKVKCLKIRCVLFLRAPALGHSTCIRYGVGRVPTRSASSGKWGGRGPLAGWHGSFPPASEREAGWMTP